jgi:hypothetical protein
MEFTADQVWAAAAAAHRINEGYLKEDVWMHNATPPYLFKTANKQLVKKWLREQDFSEVTSQDIEAGQKIRGHFKGYTLQAIRGGLNDFQAQALRIATMDTFTGRNMLEFAIVSCLPSVAERDSVRNNIKKEIFATLKLYLLVCLKKRILVRIFQLRLIFMPKKELLTSSCSWQKVEVLPIKLICTNKRNLC